MRRFPLEVTLKKVFAKSFKDGGYALTAGNLWANIHATSSTVGDGHIQWIFDGDDWKDTSDIDPKVGVTHLKLSIAAALNVMQKAGENPGHPITSDSLSGTKIPIFFHAIGAGEPTRQNLAHVGALATTVFIGPVSGYYQRNFNP